MWFDTASRVSSVTALDPRRKKVSDFSLPAGNLELHLDWVVVPKLHRDLAASGDGLQHVGEVLEREEASDATRSLEGSHVLLCLLPVHLIHVALAGHLETLGGRHQSNVVRHCLTGPDALDQVVHLDSQLRGEVE